MSDVRGVLLHHTGGSGAGNFPALNYLIQGELPAKPPPVANLGLARDGTWYTIGAGLASHAGRGKWPGIPTDNGNPHLIGVEAQSTGKGDWTPEQLESYPRGVAALLRHLGLPADRAIAHKEWRPGDKIDPAGWPGDINGFRDTVRAYLEDDMPLSDQDIYRIWDFKAHELNNPAAVHSAAVWLVGANMGAWQAEKQLVGLRTAVEKLAEAVGSAQGVNPDDLKKAISDAIAEAAPPALAAPGNGEG
ncbi:N-acetylmuramoyl-L-alanine amidase [Allokutzneria sp. A3M-2-11 16]|uniref:peptidoglycan recognition protein family protein n=1 Tax=Allokutzneria sp. A3M-2-11 16 TaxID=2962043 RepID=UPI0020B8AA10|nr:N-acetylmuramoyl-L-alanine amidase [Allokutzneria sp. A3M-2-11 16]MCP3804205.1 N-acetylmuramoyl-L-alanine amidase [Allokutzneria sp. A3M-2-11 16]